MTNEGEPSKTPTNTTIKIAAKSASQRVATGGVDPGPGDMDAAPSQAPEIVEIPPPPTASQLVVKSTNSRQIKTINDPVSLSKTPASTLGQSVGRQGGATPASAGGTSHSQPPPSASPALQQMVHQHSHDKSGAPRESTSSKQLSKPQVQQSVGASSGKKEAGSTGGPPSAGIRSPSATKEATTTAATAETTGPIAGPSASQMMQADSTPGGQEQDEQEEGEGEVEQPDGTPESPGPASSPKSIGLETGPSSGGGKSKMGTKTSSIKAMQKSASAAAAAAGAGHHGKKKKVTKFRYHKRITVRTHGKTSPSAIMDKVGKRDKLTPSAIEEMDPEELIQRAGIKGSKNTHWRVRLRQTKRLTKNGKTVTQTKVAYRDSEGNKHVRTSSNPDCKKCGKKLEDCKCDPSSSSSQQ